MYPSELRISCKLYLVIISGGKYFYAIFMYSGQTIGVARKSLLGHSLEIMLLFLFLKLYYFPIYFFPACWPLGNLHLIYTVISPTYYESNSPLFHPLRICNHIQHFHKLFSYLLEYLYFGCKPVCQFL